MPSHVGISGNEVADVLASSAHNDEDPTIFVRRFVQAKRLFKAVIRLQPPDERVVRGAPLVPHLRRGLSREECSLLHRLRTGSAFTFNVFERFDRTRSQCTSCEIIEDDDHVLWACPTYFQKRLQLIWTFRAAVRLHYMTENLLFRYGDARSRDLTSLAVLKDFRKRPI